MGELQPLNGSLDLTESRQAGHPERPVPQESRESREAGGLATSLERSHQGPSETCKDEFISRESQWERPTTDSVPISRISSPQPSGVQNDFWGPQAFVPLWATSSIKDINTSILQLHWYKKKEEYIPIIHQNISLT